MGKLFSLDNVNPMDAAQEVISRFVDEAAQNLDTWSENYRKELENYIANPQKQARAAAALGLWYSTLAAEKEEIAKIYERIKMRYKERKKQLLRQLRAGAPAARAVTPIAQA